MALFTRSVKKSTLLKKELKRLTQLIEVNKTPAEEGKGK